ncbi:MAG: hypothetical protein DRQ04_06555 [Candidatus Hydrothermota bacterium]|nr:MAG: hypothetical protein DRQ04_06555 [Candidatus Hydrothermae bacterium]
MKWLYFILPPEAIRGKDIESVRTIASLFSHETPRRLIGKTVTARQGRWTIPITVLTVGSYIKDHSRFVIGRRETHERD